MAECILIFSGILAVTLVTRLLWADQLGSDFYTQFALQKAYRENSSASLKNLPNSVIENAETFYPPFPALVYSWISEKYIVPFAVLINYLADYVTALLIFVTLRYTRISVWDAALASVLWTVQPILHPINARLTGIGARCLGPMLVFVFFVGTKLQLIDRSAVGPFVAIGAACLTTISSQFGFQALIVIATGMAISLGTIAPLVTCAAGISLSLILPGLKIANRLLLKRRHIEWYLDMAPLFLQKRNSPAYLYSLLRNRRILGALIYVATSTTPGVIVIGVSGPLLISILLNHNYSDITSMGPYIRLCWAALGASLVAAALTMRGPMSVFGEAERYVEYATPQFILLITMYYSVNQDFRQALLVAIVISITLTIGNYLVGHKSNSIRKRWSMENINQDCGELFALLQPYGSRRIATSPISLSSRLSIGAPKRHRFQFVLYLDAESKRLSWPRPPAVYPYLDLREESLSEFNIDTVIVEKEVVRDAQGPNHPSLLGQWTQIETHTYTVFIKPNSVRDEV